MNILSLFDGMACGMLAMQATGIEVDRYVAFEIDKYAVQTSSHNFPMIEHRGDVFQADFTEFRGFDFLIGGSPCTYWSIAHKNNRETEASGLGWELFSQYVRALRETQPLYFIYENNKSMSKAIRESITEAFGFEPICINSALVSAQNRQRLYWVGRRNPDGTYSRVSVDQPEDRGIILRDILDTGFPINTTAEGDKARTLMAGYYKYGTATLITNKGFTGGTTAVAEPIKVGEIGNGGQGNRIYSVEGKSVAQTATSGGIGSNTGLYAIPVDKTADKANRIGGLYGQVTHWGIYDIDGKTPTLTAAMGMGGGHIPMVSFKTDETNVTDKNPTTEKQIYEVKNGKITIKGKQYPIKLEDGFYIIRKLTVSECKRLQTVPEWYVFPVSNSQAYKMLGNGWTVLVIAHLIRATQI